MCRSAGTIAGVSAEGFALAGDVHVWRGDLGPDDYTVPTPDGRPATREFAGERLARVICADRELLDAAARVRDRRRAGRLRRWRASPTAIARVRARHPSLRTAVVTGLGAFLGAAAARAAGLTVVPLAAELGDAAARCAPAASVALLLEQALAGDSRARRSSQVVQAVRPAYERLRAGVRACRGRHAARSSTPS